MKRLIKARNKLYDSLPTGSIDPLMLLGIIKSHITDLDFIIKKLEEKEGLKESITDQIYEILTSNTEWCQFLPDDIASNEGLMVSTVNIIAEILNNHLESNANISVHPSVINTLKDAIRFGKNYLIENPDCSDREKEIKETQIRAHEDFLKAARLLQANNHISVLPSEEEMDNFLSKELESIPTGILDNFNEGFESCYDWLKSQITHIPRELTEEDLDKILKNKIGYFEFYDVTNSKGETVTFKTPISEKTLKVIYKDFINHFTNKK